MITPTLNINGTSKEELIRGRIDGIDAIEAAIKILKLITPNGRDYPSNVDQCIADRNEHYARINQLRDVQDQLLEEALYLQRGA
jgi:hypothetical protein